MTLAAPFPWFGGKSRVADIVWSVLGDVDNYVEPFAGSLSAGGGVNDANRRKERLWFSPHCLRQMSLLEPAR